MTCAVMDRIAGLLVALAIGLCVIAFAGATGGCAGTVPDVLAKTSTALKDVVAPAVEPQLKAECVRRAKACVVKSIPQDQCTPVHRCLQWTAVYVAAVKGLHRELASLNRLWADLKAEEVVR